MKRINANNMRIAGLLILIGAYALHQRGLFALYHVMRAFTIMRGR